MRNFTCVELNGFNIVSRAVCFFIHLFDMLISIVIGVKCFQISREVIDILPDKESNPMKFVAMVTIGGGAFNAFYFIESTECNIKLFFLLYAATYCIAPFMLNYINQMIDFYDCDKFSVPFKESYMKNKKKYRMRYHIVLASWYIAASVVEQVLQEFIGIDGEKNSYDYALTIIHSLLNVCCVYLATLSVVACFRFYQYVPTESPEMRLLKRQQIAFVLTTSVSAVILHLIFVILSLTATFGKFEMDPEDVLTRYKHIRVYTYLGFSVMNISSHVFGLVLAKTFLRLAVETARLFKVQDFVQDVNDRKEKYTEVREV